MCVGVCFFFGGGGGGQWLGGGDSLFFNLYFQNLNLLTTPSRLVWKNNTNTSHTADVTVLSYQAN